MKKKNLNAVLFLVVLLAVGCAAYYYAIFFHASLVTAPTGAEVCFSSHCFSVQLATTAAEQEKGLMFVSHMDADKGMLFVFDDEGVYPFWMKNTLIPLDMIWLDANRKVVFIGGNEQPCKTVNCPVITPIAKAKYVLEINAGQSPGAEIKVGDIVNITMK